MNDMIALYNERTNRMTRALEHKPNDRVPVFLMIDTWALAYSNKTIEDLKDNAELEYQVYAKAYTAFKADAGLGAGISVPFKFNKALEGGIMGETTGLPQIITGHSEIMPPEDYDIFIKEPMKYITNVILPKKFGIFREGSAEEKFGKFANAIQGLSEYGQNMAMFAERLKTEYGFPTLFGGGLVIPADYFLDYLRDFKGTMNDIRRCPDKLAAACMALVEPCIKSTLAMCPKPSNTQYISLFLHLPPYLRPKDFEKIYWPSFKAYIDFFASRGYKFLIMFEKNWEHLYDYLQELPKNCIFGLFEQDDLRKTKKAIGDTICIGGGIKTNDLYYKSPQECIDVAKGLINDLAPGGGFVFATDKALLS